MSSAIVSIVQSIHDNKQAHIKLALSEGEMCAMDCIYKTDTSPYFFLLFPPDSLPDDINRDANHTVAIFQEGKTISINSTIMDVLGDRRLHLIASDTLDPSSLREYFRVNTSTDIHASCQIAVEDQRAKRWSLDGITQDLSASGVLAQFLDEPKSQNNIQLDILLTQKRISVIGHVVRKRKLRNKRWQVAFHFDEITTKQRDALLAYILREQRKQLRENIQVRD